MLPTFRYNMECEWPGDSKYECQGDFDDLKEKALEFKWKMIKNVWNRLKAIYGRMCHALSVLGQLAFQKGRDPHKKKNLPRYCRFPRSLFYSLEKPLWPGSGPESG